MAPKKLIYGLVGIGLLSSGCTYLPAMKEATGGIPVRDIVLRIKCELSDAFKDQEGSWLVEEPKFAWLRNWTAQVDLLLQILDTSTLSPGFSANQPLHNAYNTAAGPSSISTSGVPGTTISAIPQSFAVAASANIGGQAQRTETMSFALSLRELNEWRKTPGITKLCALSDGMDLTGRLGLREWVREALTPVASEESPNLPEYLYGGVHPKPNATAPTAQAAAVPKPPPTGGGGGGKAAAGELTCSASTKIEDIKAAVTHLEQLVERDTTYANALSVARTGEQNAATSAKDAAANRSSAKSLLSGLQKTLEQYYKNNVGYSAVLDPSLSAEYRKHIKEWSTTLRSVYSLFNHIKTDADAANDAQKAASTEGDKVTGIAADVNAIAAKLAIPPKPDELEGICKEVLKVGTAIGSAPETASQVQYQAVVAAASAQATDNNAKSLTDYINGLSSSISSSPNIDPPISSIGQSVQFVLNYGGGVTPTWTFARFSGPSNPLFSVADTRTHMLNITIGPAVPGTFNTPNQSVTQNQLYLLLNNLLPPSSR